VSIFVLSMQGCNEFGTIGPMYCHVVTVEQLRSVIDASLNYFIKALLVSLCEICIIIVLLISAPS